MNNYKAKTIEKKEMKEFLVNHDDKWTLQLLDSDTEENSYRVAVPSGGNYAYSNDMGICFLSRDIGLNHPLLLWQRSETEYLMQDKKLMESVAELNGININSINDGFTGIAKAADKLSKNIRTTLGFSFNPVDDESQETVKVTIDELKHRVYKKDVSHLKIVDVYRVLELFGVESHAVGHAIKKLLCSGGRGAKDEAQDIQEAIDSLVRYQEMKNEDE